jgi:K+/H+ antiporter YhaU regulatory subunit KhtT
MKDAGRLLGTDVTAHARPGIGRRYECTTIDGDEVVVVLHHSGRRDLYVWDTSRAAPRAAVTLTDAQARTLDAVLSGAYLKPALVAIVRSNGPVVAPPPGELLRAGDRLVVIGRPQDLASFVRHVVGRDG